MMNVTIVCAGVDDGVAKNGVTFSIKASHAPPRPSEV